jgi:MYXO-CTERM domain-containing protein
MTKTSFTAVLVAAGLTASAFAGPTFTESFSDSSVVQSTLQADHSRYDSQATGSSLSIARFDTLGGNRTLVGVELTASFTMSTDDYLIINLGTFSPATVTQTGIANNGTGFGVGGSSIVTSMHGTSSPFSIPFGVVDNPLLTFAFSADLSGAQSLGFYNGTTNFNVDTLSLFSASAAALELSNVDYLVLTGGAGQFFNGTLAANVTYTYTEVPAPGALAILGLGGMAAVRRRRTA